MQLWRTQKVCHSPFGKSKKINYPKLGSEGCDLPSEYVQHDSIKTQELEKNTDNNIKLKI